MSTDHKNPNLRQAQPLFINGGGKEAEPVTVPLEVGKYTQPEPEPEPPTLPLTGAANMTVPQTPFQRKKSTGSDSPSSPEVPARDLGPVVGWMVILSGPGRGRSMELGYGNNSVGRGSDNAVRLPYGDMEISEKGHAYISYDPVTRKAYLSSNNDCRNLVYLNGLPIFNTAELSSHDIVGMGHTQLQYIPFCTVSFDWDDEKKDQDK